MQELDAWFRELPGGDGSFSSGDPLDLTRGTWVYTWHDDPGTEQYTGVQFTRHEGHEVEGELSEEGKEYTLHGIFHEGMLVITWKPRTRYQRQLGAWVLRLDGNGVFNGKALGYESDSSEPTPPYPIRLLPLAVLQAERRQKPAKMSELGGNYYHGLQQLQQAFRAAHWFLIELGSRGHHHGLWLRGKKNVHLFKGEPFIAHMTLDTKDASNCALVFSPKPRGQQASSHERGE